MSTTPTWRAFERNEITHSAAHYLLAISELSRTRAPRAADVARLLGVSRAAASLQVRALTDHGLIELCEQQRLHLTAAGADVVMRVGGKREVMRVLLRDILGVSETTADEDACKVEHLLSQETAAAVVRLARFLRSDDPTATASLAAFRRLTAACPPEARCEICGETCPLAGHSPAATRAGRPARGCRSARRG